MQLLFNAAYSSEYNPVEILWLLSKRLFAVKLLNVRDYKNQKLIKELVSDSIRDSSSATMAK